MDVDDRRRPDSVAPYDEASTPRMQERIEKATQDQDKQLDAIYNGVVRLKGAAIATNEEVIAQNQMIDQISVDISDTQTAVQEQTAAAKKVTRSHRNLGCYYMVIVLEIAALIVVLSI